MAFGHQLSGQLVRWLSAPYRRFGTCDFIQRLDPGCQHLFDQALVGRRGGGAEQRVDRLPQFLCVGLLQCVQQGLQGLLFGGLTSGWIDFSLRLQIMGNVLRQGCAA